LHMAPLQQLVLQLDLHFLVWVKRFWLTDWANNHVQPNKIYRVRIVNAASLGYYNFAIAGHNLTVISEGATPTVPVSMRSIDLSASQRYDFLLSTRNMPIATYQIQVQSNWRGYDVTAAGLFKTVYLRYQGSVSMSPAVPYNETKAWNAQISKIKPLMSSPVPTTVTKTIVLDQSQQYVDAKTFKGLDYSGANKNGYLRWTINGQSYTFPSTPYLLASYYQKMDSVFYPTSSKAVRLELNDVVDVVVQNRAALNGKCESHPFHLHGYSFFVLGQGTGLYTPSLHDASLNLVNPMEVDTFTLYATEFATPRTVSSSATFSGSNAHMPCGWAKIRFVADNPGFWAFHCHVDWHMTMGNAVIFDVASELLWAKSGSYANAMGLSLPTDTLYCGLIDANTPDPHATTPICQYSGYCTTAADCNAGNKCNGQPSSGYTQCVPDTSTYRAALTGCVANWGSQFTSDSQCCDPGAFCNGANYRQCQQPQASSGRCMSPNGFMATTPLVITK